MRLIQGSLYKAYAGHALDPNGYVHNPEGRSDHYFVKVDHLEEFSTRILPSIRSPFILISGDGCGSIRPDRPGLQTILKSPHLTRWLATNVAFIHPKIFSIPIGVAHSHLRGDAAGTVAQVMKRKDLKKEIPIYASYSMGSNTIAREECLRKTGIIFPKLPFWKNLLTTARALFNISPDGSGFDCYRHWESIYLKTIPIVVKSNVNILFYKDLPFLMLNNWSEFKALKLNQDLYDRIWNNFDLEELDFDRYMHKVLSMEHPLIPKSPPPQPPQKTSSWRVTYYPNSGRTLKERLGAR